MSYGKSKYYLRQDYLTERQLNKLDGPVKTFSLGKPLDWEEYSQLPDDLRKLYLEKLCAKRHATAKMIGKMLGRPDEFVQTELKRLSVSPKATTSPEYREEFARWIKEKS